MMGKEESQLQMLIKIADSKAQKNNSLFEGSYSELRDLLRQTKLSFYETTNYSEVRWDHYSEYYIFYIDPSLVDSLKAYNKQLEEMCATIFDVSGDFDFCGVEIKPGSVDSVMAVEPEVKFEKIEQEVLSQISQAKHSIFIAMAWFTNHTILNEINKKVKEGLIVSAVLDDNEKNHCFFQENESLFEIKYLAIVSRFQNIMHEKFCIIDSSTVLHGTYNWTEAANYNKEDMTIDKNIATISSFSDQFAYLRSKLFS